MRISDWSSDVCSSDLLKTEDFARRPLAWLDLITRTTRAGCTTISYSPTFGYDICARRMSSQTKASERFDLSGWRLAGNGADMIRPDVMPHFVDAFDDAGFEASARTDGRRGGEEGVSELEFTWRTIP